jgi:hypothetical protein
MSGAFASALPIAGTRLIFISMYTETTAVEWSFPQENAAFRGIAEGA